MDLKTKRWLILAASMLINLCIGTGYAWSVYAGPLNKMFAEWGAPAIAFTFTISNLVGPIPMIFGGRLQDQFGPKWVIFAGGILFGGGIFLCSMTKSIGWLYMCYGILAGVGMGTVYGCTIANTVKFFPDKRGLVAGLATGGYGFGPVLFAPIIASIIASSTVLNAFKITGLVYLAVILIGSQFIMRAPVGYVPEGWTPPAPAAGGGAPAATDKTWSQMLADPKYYIMLLLLTLGTTSGLMIVSQASPIAQTIVKVEPLQAASAVSLVALANCLGRICWGFISDRIGRYNALPIMYGLSGISMFLLTTIGEGTFSQFVIFAMLVGFCFGGTMGVFPALTADTFGGKNNGVNYGFMFIGFALGGYIGPMMAANFRESSGGSYNMAFIIGGILALCGIVVSFIARKMKVKPL